MTLSIPEIQAFSEQLEKESKALKQELFKMAWYMRGALSIEEAYMLDFESREMIGEIIKENLETTKKSGLPFF